MLFTVLGGALGLGSAILGSAATAGSAAVAAGSSLAAGAAAAGSAAVAAGGSLAAGAAATGSGLAAGALSAATSGTAAALKTASTVGKVVESAKALECVGIATEDLTVKSFVTGAAKVAGDEITKEGLQHVANTAMIGKLIYDKGKKDGAKELERQYRQCQEEYRQYQQRCQQKTVSEAERLRILRQLKTKMKEIEAARKQLENGAQAVAAEINRLSY